MPVAASYLHAGNCVRKFDSTVKIDAARDFQSAGTMADCPGLFNRSARAVNRFLVFSPNNYCVRFEISKQD